MKPIMVVIFSISAIVLGFVSMGLQLATLILYRRISNFVEVKYDVVAHGIWCGFLYIAAGSQGFYSSYKRPKSLKMTVFLSAIAFCGAIVAATLSGIVAAGGFEYNCYVFNYSNSCLPWQDLEWALMSFSIFAILNNLTLIYYANVARHSDKCLSARSNVVQARIERSEPPGPYIIYGGKGHQSQEYTETQTAI